MTGDKGIAEEVGTEIGEIVVETLGLKPSSQVSSDELVQSKSNAVEAENPDINIENIRQLPELASATVDAELQKQFQVLNESSKALIINSLNDLMRFFQERVSQVLEPLKHPVALGTSEINFESAKPQA